MVELWTDRTERLASGTALIGAGHEQELVVVTARPHQGRYIVCFEGVIDRSGAEALRGMVLRAPPMAVEGVLWVDELVGARAVAVDGTVLGRVLAVEANPASDLLVLDTGGLVPLRFVVSHRPGEEVTVDPPEGLLD